MRTCKDCNQSLPLTSFYFNNKTHKKTGEVTTHYYTRCKQCSKNHVSKLPSRQQEYRNSYLKGWRESNADKIYDVQRTAHLMRTYGITNDEYVAMREAQDFRCAICGASEEDVTSVGKHSHTKLYVDHDHTTGKVRGLLCQSCNTLLGKANDDISLLSKSIQYLERNKYAE
jgi:hypothetical protein